MGLNALEMATTDRQTEPEVLVRSCRARRCHRVTRPRRADAGIEHALRLAIPGTERWKTWCQCGATTNVDPNPKQSDPRAAVTCLHLLVQA